MSLQPTLAGAAVPARSLPPTSRPALQRMLPGLALSGAIALAAMALGGLPWFAQHGFSALTLAIVMGMIVGNGVPSRLGPAAAGIGFSKQTLLRAGIILYGLRLTIHDISRIGVAGVVIDALVLASTFALACWIGIRWLGLDRRTAMLIGAGSSICGAAAVLATEPVVKAKPEQVTVAVATVVVFGTVSIFLYPLLFDLNAHWGFVPAGAQAYGLYVGSTVHEVAQVVAAANSVGAAAADTAVIAKMMRVMMLAPFLIGLSAWLARRDAEAGEAGTGADARPKITIPWFAVGFVGMVLLNSLQWLPRNLVAAGLQVDTFLLSAAMAALGVSTRVSALRQAGTKPLLLALVLFAWLVVAGAAINRGVVALLG